MENTFIWRDIFVKFGTNYYVIILEWILQRNCIDRMTIAYSCHINCTIGVSAYMENFVIWRVIFTKLGTNYCLWQQCIFRRNCSDQITISYSCHTNWTIGNKFLSGTFVFVKVQPKLTFFLVYILFAWEKINLYLFCISCTSSS